MIPVFVILVIQPLLTIGLVIPIPLSPESLPIDPRLSVVLLCVAFSIFINFTLALFIRLLAPQIVQVGLEIPI
ncbi:hypothetical protein Dda_6565 [Drechslerella dactyloides]|uniref:Uncharacterized protein n=1 Tax=Drechslerella dactyloides TaxID=74499 RepID=A0AAD6NGB4_DREDA|nr:hypothetical protein Dda_6565 [Drechslerella dactyloides]